MAFYMLSPFNKGTKGGGTKKVCLPIAKIRSMSKQERQKVINAKRTAAAKGDYKRSSKSMGTIPNVPVTEGRSYRSPFFISTHHKLYSLDP